MYCTLLADKRIYIVLRYLVRLICCLCPLGRDLDLTKVDDTLLGEFMKYCVSQFNGRDCVFKTLY